MRITLRLSDEPFFFGLSENVLKAHTLFMYTSEKFNLTNIFIIMKHKGLMKNALAAILIAMPLCALSQVSNDNEDQVFRVEQESRQDYVPGEVLVKFKDSSPLVVKRSNGKLKSVSNSKVQNLLARFGATDMEKVFPNETPKPLNLRKKAKAPNGQIITENNLDQIYQIKFAAKEAEATVEKLVEELQTLEEVAWAEPNYLVYMTGATPSGAPFDSPTSSVVSKSEGQASDVICANPLSNPLYLEQWGIKALNIHKLWDKPIINSKRPIIAILDTGVDINHPDLKDNIWTNELEANGQAGYDDDGDGFVDDIHGWDFVYNYNEMDDNNSHGTHCAGVAAAADNGLGIVGANPKALIMPIKVLDDEGTGNIATIVKGINYAAARGADVISMSLGGGAISKAEIEALENAYMSSVLVAAAGNNGKHIYDFNPFAPGLSYPAAYYCVIGVQSTCDALGHLSPFSNYDPDGPVYSRCDISLQMGRVKDVAAVIYGINYECKAPGSAILSTVPGGKYTIFNGTSMATPLLAGGISALKMVKEYGNNDILMADLAHLDSDFERMISDEPREPEVFFAGFKVDDDIVGNKSIDGQVDAGEKIKMTVGLLSGWGNTGDNVKMHLEVDAEKAPFVTIENPDLDFGYALDAYANMAAKEPFIVNFSEDCDNDAQVKFLLTINCNDKSQTVEHYMGVKKMSKISGVIQSDTTLTADKVWYVSDNILIPDGVTFTIEPGTKIKVAERKEIIANGKIIAHGTPQKPIIFDSEYEDKTWSGITGHENKDQVIYSTLYCNSDTTKFSLIRTDEINKVFYYNHDIYYYFNPSDPDKQSWDISFSHRIKEIYMTDYSEIDDYTGQDYLLTDSDYLKGLYDTAMNDLEKQAAELNLSKEQKEGYKECYFHFGVGIFYYYLNPADVLKYCKLYNVGNSTEYPKLDNCEISLNRGLYYSNFTKTNIKFYSAGVVNDINYCNFSPQFDKYNRHFGIPYKLLKNSNFLAAKEKYWFGEGSSSDYALDHSDYPAYLGTSREDLARPYLYEYGNADGTFNVIDLSNMPDRPYAEAHGILWKVVVDGKDAQDEFEDMDPIGVGEHTVDVYFNRPMNIAKNPTVSYGIRRPFTQHELDEGTWSEDSTVYSIKMKITGKESSDGLNRFYVRGAEDNEFFTCPDDSVRYNMILQAAGSLATGFAATPGMGRVELGWNNENNDFEDAMGFNVYRIYDYETTDSKGNTVEVSDTLRLNKQLLDINTTEYIDYDVVPGELYHYYYKVLSTDLKEYDMSNTVACRPLTSVLGDANGSGSVDVADIVTVVNYSVGESPKPFIYEAADVNTDNAINVLDVVGIIRIISKNASEASAASIGALAKYSIENGVLYVDTPVDIAGIQVSVDLNSNATPTVASDLDGFETVSANISEGKWLFIAYSMSGKTLNTGKHALLILDDASLTDIILSDRNGNNVEAERNEDSAVDAIVTDNVAAPYPNPFVETLNISYCANIGSMVEILVHDVAGRLIHSAKAKPAKDGINIYKWAPQGISQGIYFVNVLVDGNAQGEAAKVIYEK